MPEGKQYNSRTGNKGGWLYKTSSLLAATECVLEDIILLVYQSLVPKLAEGIALWGKFDQAATGVCNRWTGIWNGTIIVHSDS